MPAPNGATVFRCLRACGLRGVACGEEGGAAQGAIEARPALAVGEALLQAVEAAEPPAQVVHHVHERGLARAWNHGAAVLELAVVGQDDVEQCLGGARREPWNLLDLTTDEVVAEWDLALEPSRVGELDGAALGGVGLDLANVVQQRAGDRDVALDAGEGG